MSNKHQVCNQCVEMNHNLMLEILYSPTSSWMLEQKNGVKALTKKFSQIFCESTGGRFIANYTPLSYVVLLEFEVYADTFALFEADYDKFMETVFGEVPFDIFGNSKLTVFNYKQMMLHEQQQFINNALGGMPMETPANRSPIVKECGKVY